MALVCNDGGRRRATPTWTPRRMARPQTRAAARRWSGPARIGGAPPTHRRAWQCSLCRKRKQRRSWTAAARRRCGPCGVDTQGGDAQEGTVHDPGSLLPSVQFVVVFARGLFERQPPRPSRPLHRQRPASGAVESSGLRLEGRKSPIRGPYFRVSKSSWFSHAAFSSSSLHVHHGLCVDRGPRRAPSNRPA